MKAGISILRVTVIEVAQSRLFQVLLALTLLAPLSGIVLSSLFLVDIGKVYLDGILGVSHLLSICFIVFVSGGLLARDMEQKVCYLLVVEPSTRSSYVLGRFFGLLLLFLILMSLLTVESVVVASLYIETKDVFYQSNYAWVHLVELTFLHSFQYVALLGFTFFVFSWATGMVEIMLFSFSGLLFTWVFPPILKALDNPDVKDQIPVSLQSFLEVFYNLLPHMTGADITLQLVHGHLLSAQSMFIYICEHIGYAGAALCLALFFFSRRDL